MIHRFTRLPTGLVLLVASFSLLAALPAFLDGRKMPSLAPMLKKVVPAVVNIATESSRARRHPFFDDPIYRRFYRHAPRRRSRNLGSGVIIDAAKGYVLTNHHVIKKAGKITVILHNKRRYIAKVVGTDPATDVAVLKINAPNLTEVRLGDSDKLRVGDFVVAIGNPFGLGQSVTSGIVSALGRSGLGIEGYENFIQTDASINPGNSGGPLVNLRGELVGLNTAILSKTGGNVGIGFAIPANMVRKLTRQLIRYGEVRRGLLGVYLQDLTPGLARGLKTRQHFGALVARIMPGSTAERAGLRRGDIITRLNGETIKSATSLRNKIGLMRVGEKITLQLLRNGETMTVRTRLGKARRRLHARSDWKTHRPRNTHSLHDKLSGAYFRNLPRRMGSGVIVASISTQSPAWHAGLRRGDIVVSVNRKKIRNLHQFRRAVAGSGRSLLLNVLRGRGALYIYVD